jgi:hypothetical protein
LQEIPPSDPVDQGDEGDWETLGEPAEGSRSPAPTAEELMSRLTQRLTPVVEPQVPVVESRAEPAVTAAVEEPTATQVEGWAPAEAGLVDIASILGAPAMTVVRSSL